MGGTLYVSSNRSARSTSLGYDTVTSASADTVFLQNKERQAHKDMLPVNIKKVRESRDSDVHPNSIPVQLYLDVTGSMGEIPPMLVREGLPTIMETMLGKGINDVSLMFGAIGDHEADRFPLQVGQFESGDAELDMWLTRTYMEGGGGGNTGESYGLAWFMANNFVETDAWDKRKQKGFVFTIGDEPVLLTYPGSALKPLFGDNLPQTNSKYTAEELYKECQKKNHVFHIHVNHGGGRHTNLADIMGQHCITVDDYRRIPEVIASTILSYVEGTPVSHGSEVPVMGEEVSEDFKITL